MISVYKGTELEYERTIKKKLLTFWLIILGAFVLVTAGFLVWLVMLDYQDDLLALVRAIIIVISCVFCGYTYMFFSIKYIKQSRYVKMLNHLDTGLKEFGEGKLVKFVEKIEVKDGVEYKQMITDEWSERRQDFLERKVLIDNELELPDIKVGENVMYKTQGNVLIEYKIIESSNKDKNAVNISVQRQAEEIFEEKPKTDDEKKENED